MGSIFGKVFQISTFGESHGAGIGVVIDGCPSLLPLDAEEIQRELDRRRPGQSDLSTPRKEGDRVEILSGVYQGKTTGTPIALLVRNTDQRPQAYDKLRDLSAPRTPISPTSRDTASAIPKAADAPPRARRSGASRRERSRKNFSPRSAPS